MNRDLWYPLYINQELECDKGILPEISQYNVKKWMYDLYTIPPVLLCEYKQKSSFPSLGDKRRSLLSSYENGQGKRGTGTEKQRHYPVFACLFHIPTKGLDLACDPKVTGKDSG